MNTYDVREEFQGGFHDPREDTTHILVHHAAALYPTGTGIEDVRAVARYHLSKGWSGIGYQVCLAEETNGGPIARYIVSDPDTERAHIWGRNAHMVGVSCLTNFTGLPEQKWIDALALAVADLKRRYPGAQTAGHKEEALPGHGTACPGPLWLDWKPKLLAQVDGLLTRDRLSADSSILAGARVRAEQCMRYILARPHGEYTQIDIARVIIPTYFNVCASVGVDPLIAVAQMIHETGNLTSYWSQRPRRNPAGIGVTGEPGVGLSFATWDKDAIPAHVGRLLAYALEPRTATGAQAALLTKALGFRPLPANYRGVAPTLRGLNGRWAVGQGYADAIVQVARSILEA